jgi:hypothetical protein
MTVTVSIIANDIAVKHYHSTAIVQVVPQKVAIAIFPNASVDGGAVGSRVKIPFSYGDATPKVITAAQGLIKRASIIIITPFNAPSMLSLGDDLNSDRLISKFVNNPMAIAEYETSPLVQYASSTEIKLYIALGEGCTQGNGFVILEV